MRTTIDIPDDIYRKLKVKAAGGPDRAAKSSVRAIQRELKGYEEKACPKTAVPLIRSSHPGTLELTNEQIDELTAFS